MVAYCKLLYATVDPTAVLMVVSSLLHSGVRPVFVIEKSRHLAFCLRRHYIRMALLFGKEAGKQSRLGSDWGAKLMVWLSASEVSAGVPSALGDMLPEKVWRQACTKY